MADVTPNPQGKVDVSKELVAIKNWKAAIKKGADHLNKMFSNSGNYFSLNLDNAQGYKVHIYLGCDEKFEKVQVYMLMGNYDEKGMFELLRLIPLKKSKGEAETLRHEIDNWNNKEERLTWVKQVCESKTMVQAFVIDATDFIPGNTHDCYFALKETTDYGIQADLVVVNVPTNGNRSVLEDMARPVPPYSNGYNSGHSSTKKSNFKVLTSLGI